MVTARLTAVPTMSAVVTGPMVELAAKRSTDCHVQRATSSPTICDVLEVRPHIKTGLSFIDHISPIILPLLAVIHMFGDTLFNFGLGFSLSVTPPPPPPRVQPIPQQGGMTIQSQRSGGTNPPAVRCCACAPSTAIAKRPSPGVSTG